MTSVPHIAGRVGRDTKAPAPTRRRRESEIPECEEDSGMQPEPPPGVELFTVREKSIKLTEYAIAYSEKHLAGVTG
ncbi:hypothetical protein AB0N65_17610 [Paenarthrobacter sp. NPDC089322]|uniref:hypothetical protein n=1 Tax=Paenarthrobacter sp. NPDC089322 TaxID=3155065 RepID=UPI00342195D5